MSSATVTTYWIITKDRQGGRVFLKCDGRWTRNRFHTDLRIFHNRDAADTKAYAENATVVPV